MLGYSCTVFLEVINPAKIEFDRTIEAYDFQKDKGLIPGNQGPLIGFSLQGSEIDERYGTWEVAFVNNTNKKLTGEKVEHKKCNETEQESLKRYRVYNETIMCSEAFKQGKLEGRYG
jgi:hypothetical protein